MGTDKKKNGVGMLWFFYSLSLMVGILGLANVGTKGEVTGSLAPFFVSLFGKSTAASVFTITSMTLDVWWVWFVVGYVLKRKINLVQNPADENVKKYENAKKVLWGVLVLLLVFLLLGAFFLSAHR